jgi:threonine synthase
VINVSPCAFHSARCVRLRQCRPQHIESDRLLDLATRAFWEAKRIAWIILDRLDVAFGEEEGFNPTGSFKDLGMAMAISPVPARLDAVLAQLGP